MCWAIRYKSGKRRGALMNSTLTCPACGHTQPASQDLLGRKVRCPNCRVVFRVTTSELKAAIEPRSAQPGEAATGKRRHARLGLWSSGVCRGADTGWLDRPARSPEARLPASPRSRLTPARTCRRPHRPRIPLVPRPSSRPTATDRPLPPGPRSPRHGPRRWSSCRARKRRSVEVRCRRQDQGTAFCVNKSASS